ncbi:sensor histidine kinase [Thermophilibacter sp.]
MTGTELAEPVRAWVAALLDWLVGGATIEGLLGMLGGPTMVDASMLVAMLALGIGLGAVATGAGYLLELSRAGRFLGGRDRTSNARLTSASWLPGVAGLVDAVNAELDAAATERVAALRAADEFSRGLSALSHDVRTPLTGARGYLQLAREETDAARKGAELAAADARLAAMSGLLDELFSYARAADPDAPLELGPVALRPVVEAALLGHFPEFEARGWEPTLELGDPAPVVEADAEALARIVENLVANALRHGAGPLSVTARPAGTGRVAVGFSNPVADPGALDADRLFERFYQGDASRSTAGSGLGLAVAARLAAAQGMGLAAHLDGDVLTVTLEASLSTPASPIARGEQP